MRVISIGRNATNDIVLNDAMISRQHAQLFILDNGQIMIKDSGSSNGTFVNGNKVVETYLKPGDIVKCGGTFLNWQQYKAGIPNQMPPIQQAAYQPHPIESDPGQIAVEPNIQQSFSIGLTLKYLCTRILEVGDLLKTEWDRTSSIFFFLLMPLGISLAALLYLYTKIQYSFLYQVFLPLILIALIYGVAQFLTLTLLSINKSTIISKTLFASSIYSFLQFSNLVLLILFALIAANVGSKNSSDAVPFYFILAIITITLAICITLSIVIFIYQYFRAIGISKSLSIYSVVFAIMINFLLQAAIIYVFILSIGNNFSHSFQNISSGRFLNF